MIDILEFIFLAKTDLPGTVFPSGLITRGEDPVLAKNRIRATVPRTQGDFLNSIEWILKLILKVFFFV